MSKTITLEDFLNGNSPIDPQDPPTPDPFTSDPTPPTPPADDDDPPADDDDLITGYYEYALDLGLIAPPEDFVFDGTPEAFKKAAELTKDLHDKRALENINSRLSSDFQDALEFAISTGGTLDDYLAANTIPNVSTLDLTKPENQRKVVAEHLRNTTQYTEERIQKIVNMFEANEELASQASEAAQELEQIRVQHKTELENRIKADEARLKQENALRTEQLVNAINSSNFIHPTRREKVRSFFFNPISIGGQQTTGFNETIRQIISNPEHQAQLADILLDYTPNTGFSMERLEKRVKTRSTSAVRTRLDQAFDPKNRQGNPARVNTNNTDFLEK